MSRKEWGLLLGLLLAVVVVFGVLGYLFLQPTPPAPALPSPEATYTLEATVTAKTTYPLAQEVARTRQPDVQLASVSATWAETNVKRVGEPAVWTFQFYSPTANRTYTVVVDRGQARVIRETIPPYPSTPIPEEGWPVDSTQALNTWLNYGGSKFLMEHLAGTQVVAQLATLPEGSRATWTVVGLSERGQAYFTLLVDAATGAPRTP